MSKSPGHQKFPDHEIREKRLPQRMQVEVNGDVVAASSDILELEEDGHATRYYFPRADVSMEKLERTETTSECPFKGTARYYNLKAGGETLEDSVWTYEDPYDEHAELQGRLAFYDDTSSSIQIRRAT